MKIKSLFILLFLSVFTFAHAQLTDYSIFDKKFNFYVANDLGRNGYYDQKHQRRTEWAQWAKR